MATWKHVVLESGGLYLQNLKIRLCYHKTQLLSEITNPPNRIIKSIITIYAELPPALNKIIIYNAYCLDCVLIKKLRSFYVGNSIACLNCCTFIQEMFQHRLLVLFLFIPSAIWCLKPIDRNCCRLVI